MINAMSMKKIVMILGLLLGCIGLKAQQYVLENEHIKAGIDLNEGFISKLENKETGWEVLGDDKSVARAFEAIVRFTDGAVCTIDASSQKQPEITSEGNTLTLVWDKWKVGEQELDVTFTGTIRMMEDGLIYGGKLVNHSDAVVEQLAWPFMGEATIPADTEKMFFQYMNYSKFNTVELYPKEAGRGWSNLPEHSFTLIHNTKQGLYLSSMDHKFDEYIRCEYEIIPTSQYAAFIGTSLSKQNAGERKHMRLQVKAARMLYAQENTEVTLVPFILTTYTGTWHKGVDIYKKWRSTWFVAPHRAEWLKHVNSWQQLQINTSESRINFKIKDLYKYVDECKRYGVDAIQLTGWAMGGQDRGVPCHDLDPRLGTVEEFKKAISDANKKGVKILLFTKFTWADLTADYHEQYLPHLAWNQAQDTCIHPGYNYNTYTQLIGINTRRFGILCMMDEDLREKLHVEFQKCLDLGAPGMVYDENQHHAGTILCFNPNHGHKVPGFIYKGADLLGREFYEMCQKSNPDFLMTGEGPYDLQTQYYATYTRGDYNQEPVLRYIDSEVPIAFMVTDHDDRNRVNACVANRYSISYEPRNFKGHLCEIPRLMAYGQKLDNMRKQYEDFLWNGEFMDVLGAQVTGKNIRHTVFRNKKNNKKAVVVWNTDTQDAHTATVLVEKSNEKLVMVSPDNCIPTPFDGKVEIGPQSLVVILED